MPLKRDQLQSDILKAFKAAAGEKDPDAAQTALAQKLSDAINAFVTGAAVRGIAVDILKGNPAQQTADGKLV